MMDKSGSGSVSLEEFLATMRPDMKVAFPNLKQNSAHNMQRTWCHEHRKVFDAPTRTLQSSEYSDLIAVAFDVFDQNNDGLIGPEELNSGMRSSKLKMLRLQSLVVMLTMFVVAATAVVKVDSLYQIFDVIAALANVYPPPTSTEIMELIASVPNNNSNKISKSSFVKWMQE